MEYIGHATVLIEESGGHRVLTDPYFGKVILGRLKREIPPSRLAEELPSIDLVLVSHTHPDHFDQAGIERLRSRPRLILPWGCAKTWKAKGWPVTELRPWQNLDESSFHITAVPAKHMGGHCLGYLIEAEGKTIYFTGDTKWIRDLDSLGERSIDLMLMPYGGFPGVGSIWTSAQAAEAVRRLHPKTVIPIHWGTFRRWWTPVPPETPEQFCQRVLRQSPQTECRILQPGQKHIYVNSSGGSEIR